MSPPGGRGASRRRAARRPVLRRRDLEALLAQLDAAGPGRDTERERLRRLLAEAIAEDQTPSATSGDEDWTEVGDPDGLDDDDWAAEWEDDDDPKAWGWGRRPWERFEQTGPIRVEGGLRARSRRGEIGESWWSRRFLAAIEATLAGGRSTRGRTYARQGQVLDLSIAPGRIEARVQGSRTTPYRVRLVMEVVPDTDWDRIVGALATEAGYAAKLLSGVLPHEIEDVFAAEGASLFPGPGARLSTECSCPDWANPCKHVAAVCYLVAENFDRDPFGVLLWRGRSRERLLSDLRQARGTGVEPGPGTDAMSGTVREAPPPLGSCLVGFYKAGPELASVRVRPLAAQLPAAVLRHLVPGVLTVANRDVAELLAARYGTFTMSAARRALRDP